MMERLTKIRLADQWQPKGDSATVPDAYEPSKRHAPNILTTDLSLRLTRPMKDFTALLRNPCHLADAFARLVKRPPRYGRVAVYLGRWVPRKCLILAGPVPSVDHALSMTRQRSPEGKVLASGLSTLAARYTAGFGFHFPAVTARGSHGAQHPPAPQKDMGSETRPQSWRRAQAKLEAIQKEFQCPHTNGKKISLADRSVLACSAAVDAAQEVPVSMWNFLSPRPTDASQSRTVWSPLRFRTRATASATSAPVTRGLGLPTC